MGWPEGDESSVLRLVTGVVLLGGIGGEGLAGTRLAPPGAWVKSPTNGQTVKTLKMHTKIKPAAQLRPVSETLASFSV